jgi:inosine triphosphate pyrophosphatase
MKGVTFITGNQKKAEYLQKYLGVPIAHKKIDLDELQSLELREIVEHKLRQAFAHLKSPVLVEDSALEFCALGKLPGTFIKFFEQEMSFTDICSLLNNKERSAIAKCGFGYFDGVHYQYFE